MKLPKFSAWRHLFGRGEAPADCRSARLVAVIHCILDQNVRDAGAAVFPASNWALLELCRKHGVGLLQMPCPELRCLGMARSRPAGCSLREALDSPQGRASCRQTAQEVAEVIAAHIAAGHRVLAVLGGNMQSPGCAVHQQSSAEIAMRSGIFIQVLAQALRERGLEIPFRGMRDADPQLMAEDLRWLSELFARQP